MQNVNVLEKIYEELHKPSQQVYLKAEIEENHKELIQILSKSDRKKVLKIIDDLMLITLLQTKESFICGLKLAMEFQNELQNYKQSDYILTETEIQSPLEMEVKSNEHNS